MAFLHGQEVARLLERVDQEDINILKGWLQTVAAWNGRVYTAGNGGSAANASHLAAHLNECGIAATCLSDNLVRFSALANDINYEQVFAIQLEGLPLGQNDSVVVLSCSGNSPNVLRLLEFAKEANVANRIGLLGFGGGKAQDFCNLSIRLDSLDYGAIEDCHSAIIHAIRKVLLTDGHSPAPPISTNVISIKRGY